MLLLAVWMSAIVFSAALPDVRSIALPSEAIGPEWVMIDSTDDAQYERIQYFNNAVDHSRFRMVVITLTSYSSREEADAETELKRSVLEGYWYATAPEPSLGSGAAYRASQIDDSGLLVTLRLYRVGQIGVTVSVTAMADDQSAQDVEAEVGRIALLQGRRAEGVLLGDTVAQPLRRLPADSVLDPTPLVVTPDSLGETWVRDGEDDKGGPAEQLRTHTRFFHNDDSAAPGQHALVAVTLARDEPTARMTLGLFVADWEANGHKMRASNIPGIETTTFEAIQTWPNGTSEAACLYQVGTAVVQVSVSAQVSDPADLVPLARAASLSQSMRIADLWPTLWHAAT